MKLIVQIPCFNEEQTLPQTLGDIPRQIDGISKVEVLIIDDGSSDRTIEVARDHGADHIIRHKTNRGLARTFRTGVDAALRLGADIIVNTDGDNQYRGADIARLVQPVALGQYDIVVGDRQTDLIDHFSRTKRLLQRLGSTVVRQLSGVDVPDAVSGFRAFSRNAALQLNIISSFSYTIEMLIQAGKKHITVGAVPVGTNAKTRESRLFKSIPKFVERSLSTMLRMYSMYQPLRVFFYVGLVMTSLGLVPIVRFLYFVALGDSSGHIQSLVIGGAFMVVGILIFVMGLLGDLLSFNRHLLELALERIRRLELAQMQQGQAGEQLAGDSLSEARAGEAIVPDDNLIIANAEWVQIAGRPAVRQGAGEADAMGWRAPAVGAPATAPTGEDGDGRAAG